MTDCTERSEGQEGKPKANRYETGVRPQVTPGWTRSRPDQ
jgi:hypothetical protein